MAEALLKRWGSDKFNAYSAGSKPKGKIHPKTLETLDKNNFNTEGLHSKSWDVFTEKDSPDIDFVITVCSNAANETCPIIPGSPISGHWDINDPAKDYETEEQQDNEFHKAFLELEQRMQLFINLPAEKLGQIALHEHLQKMSDPK
jgi:protein-tyrosine-phosphatase